MYIFDKNGWLQGPTLVKSADHCPYCHQTTLLTKDMVASFMSIFFVGHSPHYLCSFLTTLPMAYFFWTLIYWKAIRTVNLQLLGLISVLRFSSNPNPIFVCIVSWAENWNPFLAQADTSQPPCCLTILRRWTWMLFKPTRGPILKN